MKNFYKITNFYKTSSQKAKQWLDRLSSGGVKIHSLSLLN